MKIVLPGVLVVLASLCGLAGLSTASCGRRPPTATVRRMGTGSDCGQRGKEQFETSRSKQIVSQYSAVFDRPPRRVPSFKFVDGPITGNGDIGLTVSGPPEHQRYWISKNDFWKSGPDFKQCGPSLIGGMDIRIADLKNASYRVEQMLYEPVISAEFAREDKTVNIDARVAATDNVILLTLTAGNAPVTVNLDLWAKEGYGSQTAGGQEGDIRWVTRKFHSDNLRYPTEAAIAVRSLDSPPASFLLAPGKPVTIVASVITNHESETYDADARKKAARIDREEVDRLNEEHKKWWREFWAQSFVEIEDKLLEKFYYASHYIMACCSRNVNFPPGLYGNWITRDRTAWAGDLHLNYNYEAPFWALYSSNHVDLTDPYDAPLLEHLPIFRENARKYLNKNGAYASVGIGPKGLTSRFFDKKRMDENYGKLFGSDSYDDLAGQPMFLGQKSNAVFAGMNMILRYYYTYDEQYIRKVYPYLSAVAEFWEDYLKFEDGRYVIYDDNYGEVGPWQGKGWQDGYGDFNPITSLGFLRAFFKGMLEISDALNVDHDKQAVWKHILTHLSDFPVHEDGGRRRFRACEGGDGSARNRTGLSWIMMHSLVFPATNIGLGSPPELLKMIREDIAGWTDRVWLDHGNAFQTVCIGAARVGYDPDLLMSKAREKIKKHAYPNLMIPAEGGGIETCGGIPGMINEMMLQTHNGLIRVFPVFPADQKASFHRLRTFGAFLVSSAIKNGQIQYVLIESEKGRDCHVLNPWPDQQVVISRSEGEVRRMTGEELVLETRPGEQLLLAPEGVEVKEMADLKRN